MLTGPSVQFGRALLKALERGIRKDEAKPGDVHNWANGPHQKQESGEWKPVQVDEIATKMDVKDLPPHIGTVADAVKEAGGRVLLVGGCVRDQLQGKKPKDHDLEVYGVHPDKLEEILGRLGKVDAVGKSFGVLKVSVGQNPALDVSLPRREAKTQAGHKGFEVKPDPSMTIEEAAARRDFTINTMAMDPKTGQVFDPYGGVKDLKAKVLRATTPTVFAEDPLRVLRGAQFAARFGMTVAPETMELMKAAGKELSTLPHERVAEEWKKLLLKSDKPSIGMDILQEVGAMEALHPELFRLAKTPQDARYHPEGNVWQHTRMVVDQAAELTKNESDDVKETIRYAALLHDVGKPDTTIHQAGGGITSHEHEEKGEPIALKILQEQFGLAKEKAERIAKLVGSHLKPMMLYQAKAKLKDSAIRRLAVKIAPATIEELVLVARADHGGRLMPDAKQYLAGDWLLDKARNLGVKDSAPKPLLMGRHLIEMGMKPGVEMGKVLRQVYEWQLDGKVDSVEVAQRLAAELRRAGSQPEEPEMEARRPTGFAERKGRRYEF